MIRNFTLFAVSAILGFGLLALSAGTRNTGQ